MPQVRIGLPPRMWGRPEFPELLRDVARFTPTDVGTTTFDNVENLPEAVYPHGCGDDFRIITFGKNNTGLPPRMWGRRSPCLRGEILFRFTPTDVGTTSYCQRFHMSGSVYPHGCGDDPLAVDLASIAVGLPPRMWGRRIPHQQIRSNHRFTPTDVGTTYASTRGSAKSPVYPHGCGDDFKLLSSNIIDLGLPPRMWGRRPSTSMNLGFWRFTPTDVGTTSFNSEKCDTISVYPHGCGDDSNILCSFKKEITRCGCF